MERTCRGSTLHWDRRSWAESNPKLTCAVTTRKSSKNSKANRIKTGERSGGIGEICSVEVDEK
jgi:hypothetical protein